MALLAAIIIIGITMTAAGKSWRQVAQREKEEELLFRGNQYVIAIERFYLAMPNRRELPQSIDALLKDDRFPQARRHLRHAYPSWSILHDLVGRHVFTPHRER